MAIFGTLGRATGSLFGGGAFKGAGHGLSTMLGGGSTGSGAKRAQRETAALRDTLAERLGLLDETSPTESATYLARIGAARDAMRRQADEDSRGAAARGLTGSTYELAQSANRSGGLLATQRAASADAEGQQQMQTSQLLSLLLGAQGLTNQAGYQKDAAAAQSNALLGQLLGTAVGFLPGIGGAASAATAPKKLKY